LSFHASPTRRSSDLEGADFGEDAEDLEARIDHATLLHDSGEETSLFFVSPVADTVGTEHAPRLQLRGGIGDHEEVVDELTLAPEDRKSTRLNSSHVS